MGANDMHGEGRHVSAKLVSDLAGWAAGARGVAGRDILVRAATILSDDIAAMVAASTETPVLRMRPQTVGDEATVFSAPQPGRTTTIAAAEANGLAATWCELDEGARSVPCHAGAYVLPALLAEAEKAGLSTLEVLDRLAVSYEVVVRVARAFRFAVMRTHPHAMWAAFGGAAGASIARGHDADTLLRSVSGGISMAFAGPFGHAVDGALVRNAWTAAGARIGIMCADFAEVGIGGVSESFHDGLVTSMGGVYEPISLSDLGTVWAVSDGYHKSYACCQYAHSAVEASVELHRQVSASGGDGAASIAAIIVETHPRGETLTAVEPANTLSARFSMAHAVAASAVLGTGGQEAFDEATLHHPLIAALRREVSIRPHPAIGAPPHDRPARVTWRLADGRELTAECLSAVGGADRPLARTALMEKLHQLTSPAFPAMAGVMEAMTALDEVTLARPWRLTVDRMMRA